MYRKILVIKLRHIGDVLLATPVFKTLKENFPSSHITALVNKGTEAVLENNPHIDEILTYDRDIKKLPPFKRYKEELKFLRKIRNLGFDTAIELTGGDRSALISFFSGAKKRFGIKAKGFLGKKFLYTKTFSFDGAKHIVLQNLEILEKMGLKIKKPKIILHVSEEEKNWAEKLILPSGRKLNEKIVHIHSTSRWSFKCWKDEYMAKVIKWLLNNGCRVILTSSKEDRELEKIKAILSYIDPKWVCHLSVNSGQFKENSVTSQIYPLINLAGKITLRQLIAISSISDMYFGIDTAPMHIAAALGKPVVALFGPSGAFHWGPWDNEVCENPYSKRKGIQKFGKNIVIQRDWKCIPCGQAGCEGSKISKCLFDIKPEEVIAILSSILIFDKESEIKN